MAFPNSATPLYGGWTQVSESNADLETRFKHRGLNVMDAPYNAVGDGVADDTAAVIAAIAALPRIGGRLHFPAGKYRFTSAVSNAVNSKGVVIFVGDNTHAFEGMGANPHPQPTQFYLKDLTTYWYTKNGTTNDVLSIEGIFFDGANGGLWSTSTTCPGVIYSADLNQYYLTLRRCMFQNFGYVHTNVTGSRAVVDIQPVWGMIDECLLGSVPNGRLLYMAGTHTTIRETEFNKARECYYVLGDNFVFDHCAFENATVIGAQLGGSVKREDCWYENIGYNVGTAYTSGIAQRNHGLAFGSGALQPAGGIITPFQQLYGSCHEVRAHFNSFATGRNNFTPAAWYEALGQNNQTDVRVGGALFVSGVKQEPQALFSSTMAMTAPERYGTFMVQVDDGWQATSGSSGASLFNSPNNDFRKVNVGYGRIVSADYTMQQFVRFAGGRIVGDVQNYNTAQAAAPGASQYPWGGQWEIGDRFVFPVPVAGGATGIVCTTAGTGAPVWKTYGRITA
jgi:Pectate lyase superfamily protein